jgi:predicted MFS family arabinose efflux permease
MRLGKFTFSRQMVRQFFTFGRNQRSAAANLLVNGLLMFSAMHMFLSYGRWFEGEYGLTAARLGFVALILGILDLVGSVLVSVIVDDFGRRRSVFLGLGLMLGGALLLPFMNIAYLPALIALGLVRFQF